MRLFGDILKRLFPAALALLILSCSSPATIAPDDAILTGDTEYTDTATDSDTAPVDEYPDEDAVIPDELLSDIVPADEESILTDDGAESDDTILPDEDAWVRPMDTVGWIILNGDRANASRIIEKAAAFGVTEIHLSHDIIMDIDEIQDDAKATLISDIAQEAHAAGLKVWVWAHELANNSYAVCYNPDDVQWEQRRKVYRDALQKVPEIDGVVLMFGSSSPDPWYAQCVCLLDFSYCGDVENKQVHIVKLLIDMVRTAVVEESGRELIVRTFIHFPAEQGYVLQALAEEPHTDYTVMPKDVPQDWQPYHPHDPGFGGALMRDTVAEFDLAGEYWGQSKIPFALPDYLQYRLRHQHALGGNGAFGRVERGGNSAFGTPNEVNLYAFSKLLKNVDYPVDLIWEEWVQSFYGLEPGSAASAHIIAALRRTFDIGRKMYYPKGFWMAKSSDIPENADLGLSSNFEVKKINLWDPDYTPLYQELKDPTAQTIADIAQEKHEARYLAEASLADLEEAKEALPTDRYDDLLRRLSHLRDCVDVFDHVHQAIFRYQRAEEGSEAHFLRWNLDELLSLADHMEATYGAGVSPCSPDKIREFVDSVKDKAESPAAPFTPMLLTDIRAEEVTATGATIRWRSSQPAQGGVEYGVEIPDYGFSAGLGTPAIEHEATLTGLTPDTLFRFRVRATATDATALSGDLSFRTAKK